MTKQKSFLNKAAGMAATAGVALTSVSAMAASLTGPSSSESPYLLPLRPDVHVASLLTVGDSVNFKADGVTPYRMVGIPDGLGAFENEDDDTFTLVMNHELTGSVGAVRDHGFRGAFVSKWIINKETMEVLHGEDLIKHAWRWDVASKSYQPITNAFSRFCSADLAAPSAFYNRESRKGYAGRIFLNGEETGTEGRAFAHFLDGNSYELPYLGKLAWENVVANPAAGDKTVVMGTDDGTGGQVYVYVGDKKKSGSPVERAGLSGGKLYGIKVSGYPNEIPATGIPSGTAFGLFELGDVSDKTGAQIESMSVSNAVTSFLRPEDGCWDPKNPRDFYFVTTDSFNGKSRLWRLRFHNPAKPALGGTIDMLLDGTEGQKMMDNMTVKGGSILIQEDVGNNPFVGRLLRYNIGKDTLEEIATLDPDRFTVGGANFLTQDEESSGVIPMTGILGSSWYLAVVQAHYAKDAELVEGGQLLLMHVPQGGKKHEDHD
ncbi:MAG TPA: phytase [Candidatus Paceibacterota bacterium]|nr:phytase [Candidatus Paceibacterota bacterium]